MQTVTAAWTAEEKDETRNIVGDLLVSWKKDNLLTNRTFTIGVSTIGGGDIIGANPGAVGSPGQWRYFDESDYLLGLAWERSLNMPTGGLAKGLAEARLDNTSGRFLPGYMGGSSELHTAILPRRPFIINAGFNFDGIDQVIPQFSGVLTKSPEVDLRRRDVDLQGADYSDFFYNRYLDNTIMFTGQRTDQVIETLFNQLGMATSQYELDTGINVIPFGLFEKGSKFSEIISQLVQAEYGHLYQDEEGKFRFENRQHWDSSPHNAVQREIATAQVLEAKAPGEDHIINVVEVRSKIFSKQPAQVVINYTIPIEIGANGTSQQFFGFDNPMLAITNPTAGGADSYYEANSLQDGTGSDKTSSVSIKSLDLFAESVKITFQNNSSSVLYVTKVVITGRPAKAITDLYHRASDDSSATAFEERPYTLENPYIQNADWAKSIAQLILNDFSEPENLQQIVIRAIPELQLGDLISWQGRYWRVFGIKNTLDPSAGFVQELQLLQRTIQTYFRIGISTIGGEDLIAP